METRERIEAAIEGWKMHNSVSDWIGENGMWVDDDEVEEGTIDPDGVFSSAIEVADFGWVKGWDCIEGSEAYRHKDDLYYRWYRTNTCGARKERDCWIRIQRGFFTDDE